jgi:putative membrane protein
MENYSYYCNDMILRDYLARDRTVLANERTLLAYVRTFAGFFAAGAGMVKLFDEYVMVAAGIAFMTVSPIFLVIGAVRFVKMHKRLKPLAINRRNEEY